jgi:hypothetical protein
MERKCEIIKGVEYIPSIEFTSSSNYLLIKKEIQKLNRFDQEVIKAAWYGALYKNFIENFYTASLYLKWIDRNLGFGVFALNAIKEGHYIGEYAGQVKRYLPIRFRRNSYIGELRVSSSSELKLVIDAEKKGNITRFINHSVNPNVQSMTILNKGLMHVVFVAKKQIDPNVQLAFDYGQEYWKYRETPEIIN